MTNIAKTAILAKYDYFLLTIEEYRGGNPVVNGQHCL